MASSFELFHNACMVLKHTYLNTLPLLHSAIMSLKGEVGSHALNSHVNYIVDHGKSWNCVFEFLWEPCNTSCVPLRSTQTA